jgi:membrane protease YdiL (CAAX protease family)
MNPTLETLLTYIARVLPGMMLGAAVMFATRRQPRVRISLYLTMFVLLRDAMTPLGLWSFGTQGFFWIRLASDPWFLVLFAISCFGLSLGLYYFDRDNRPLFKWTRGNLPVGLLWGFLGAIIFVTPLDTRGGEVPLAHLPAILLFALLGNLLEEALFRGYVFGSFAEQVTPIKAGIASGVVFAFCHCFLATTVTAAGYPLLLFTLWEGIIAGLVGAKYGVLPAALTHGTAIFLLSSSLI